MLHARKHGGGMFPGNMPCYMLAHTSLITALHQLHSHTNRFPTTFEHDAVQFADDKAKSEYRRQVEAEGRKHEKASPKA